MRHFGLISRIVAGIGILSVLAAAYLVATPPSRYGTYGDGFACGQVDGIEYTATATAYYATSGPLPGDGDAKRRVVEAIGTCPYTNYFAKTWALDLWAAAAVAFGAAYFLNQKSRKGPQATADTADA